MTSQGSTFHFTAVDGAGKRLRGLESAPTAAILAQNLEARGLVVLDIGTADAAGESQTLVFGRSNRRALIEFTLALGALLPAGLPLSRALHAASNLTGGAVAEAIQAVRLRVERGDRLAAALAQYPALFSPLYLGLVRAGERSGDLAAAFQRLAAQLEREEELRFKLLSASVYPLILAAAGGTALLILLTFVIPRFVALLDGTGATIPATTQALLAVSTAVTRHWPIVTAMAVLLAFALAWARTTEEGRRALATLVAHTPGLEVLRQQQMGARVARLSGTLIGGGLPLLTALDDTIECLNDPLARDEMVRVRDRVRDGAGLRESLDERGFFHPLLGQLVGVGEASGRLSEFLLKAAEVLEARTQRAVERLVAVAEPVMILLFGGAVGMVALALLQAVYSVNAGSFR